jgi:catechol 2,3-dioxygenase-like lactoylglutathione lyase family enzyme
VTVASRPITDRINVVYLYVRDLDRSMAFYRDLLGLPLVKDAHEPRWAEAKLPGGLRFALHQAHQELQTPGTVVIDFEAHDLESARDRLRAAGVRCGSVERAEWGSVLEVFDPDGYHVDLFEGPKR